MGAKVRHWVSTEMDSMHPWLSLPTIDELVLKPQLCRGIFDTERNQEFFGKEKPNSVDIIWELSNEEKWGIWGTRCPP